MKRVAVIGGGPAGAFAAATLAAGGLRTLVIDEKPAWEKPCGGGLTYKAYQRYPFLLDNDAPKRLVHDTYLWAPRTGSARLALRQPLLIYSRLDLNRLLLERAERAGAQMEQARVTGLERTGAGWKLRTRTGAIEADYCMVATGARNPLRAVGTEWTADDTMYALGYYVPASQEHIDIQFLPRLEGYIWVFPRMGHLSVGICGKGVPAPLLRARLEAYMEQRGIPVKDGRFYAHMLPALSPTGWRTNRVAGAGWMAVGDAGGLVDPITGEGLYYAMRSGDLAAATLLESGPEQAGAHYRTRLQRDFTRDLEFGSRLAKPLFFGSLLFSSVPRRMVQLTRSSTRFHALMGDLFAGTQSYLGLRGRIMRSLNGTVQETVINFFLNRLIPVEKQAG
jgi:flavin-dependent dehydrogenase